MVNATDYIICFIIYNTNLINAQFVQKSYLNLSNELFDSFKEGLFEYIHFVSNITNYYIISGIDQMISSGLERFTIILQLKIYITCFVIIPYCYQSDKPFVSSWNRREAAPLYDMILYTNTNINHGLSNNKPPISHMLKEIIAINLIILSQAVEIEYKQRQILLSMPSTFLKYFQPY